MLNRDLLFPWPTLELPALAGRGPLQRKAGGLLAMKYDQRSR